MDIDQHAQTKLRREFHRFPELGFQEQRTKAGAAGAMRDTIAIEAKFWSKLVRGWLPPTKSETA